MKKKVINAILGSVETTQQSQSPEVQPAAVSVEQPTVEPYEHIDLFPYVTFTRTLTSAEAKLLRQDFDRYAEAHKDGAGHLEVKQLKVPDEEQLHDEDEPFFAAITKYYTTYEVIWYLKEYTEYEDDVKVTFYRLDVEYGFELLLECDGPVYDGNALKSIIERGTHISKAKDISPLLVDYSSLVLSDIEYCIVEPLAPYMQPYLPVEAMDDLLKNCNMPVLYTETETFNVYANKGKERKDSVDTLVSTVKVKIPPNDVFCIRRYFDNNYTLQQLIYDDSVVNKRIIELILSEEYRCRVTANYLRLAIMDANYYSMDKATELIEKRISDELEKLRFFWGLSRVSQHGGVHKAKMYYKCDRVALGKFNRCLNDLAEFGINPVVIPEKHKINCIPNPIQELDQYSKQVKSCERTPSNIEIKEKVGNVMLECPSYYYSFID